MRLAGYAVRVADGDGAIGVLALESAVGVANRLALLGGVLSLLGFQRDLDGADADFNVNAPAARLLLFLVGVQAVILAQNVGGPYVEGVFVVGLGHGSSPFGRAARVHSSILDRLFVLDFA